MSAPSSPSSCDPERHPVDVLADEFAARCRRGERPSVNDYITQHPELADQLRDVLPPIALMERLKKRNLSGAADAALVAPSSLERLGDFTILREIGRGGMGIVYEARQESLGRIVALKVLSRASLLDPQRVERFEREARAAAGLHHTNIVPVFGVGQADGMHYIAMQHIQGQTLAEIIREQTKDGRLPGDPTVLRRARSAAPATETPVRRPSQPPAQTAVQGMPATLGSDPSAPTTDLNLNQGLVRLDVPAPAESRVNFNGVSGLRGRLTDPDLDRPTKTAEIPAGRSYWRWAARLARQIADALDHAHRHGILHRDIKPANLLLDRAGDVWVTDFGLAKLGESNQNVTQAGDVIGTLQYLAPEGLKTQTDARGDIYGLGATLYELISLRPPYEAPHPAALMRKLAEGEPERPRKHNHNIPADLETIALKAMARLPENRYQTAGELAADLGNFLADRPIKARRASMVELAWRWCRRNRAVSTLGAATAVAALAAIAIGWTAYGVTSRALDDEAARRAEAESARKDADVARQRADQNVALSLTGFEDIFNAIAPIDSRPGPGDFRNRMIGRGGPNREGPGREGPGREGPGGFSGPGGTNAVAQEAAVLQSILNFYDRFSKQNPTNTTLRAEAAKAYRRVGDSYLAIGQSTDADVAYRRSAAMYSELIRAEPKIVEHQLGLAEAATWLGFESAPLLPADEQVIHQAAVVADGLVDQLGPRVGETLDPDDAESVARILLRDGTCLQLSGQMSEAERRFRRSVQAWSAFYPRTDHQTAGPDGTVPLMMGRPIVVGPAMTADNGTRRDRTIDIWPWWPSPRPSRRRAGRLILSNPPTTPWSLLKMLECASTTSSAFGMRWLGWRRRQRPSVTPISPPRRQLNPSNPFGETDHPNVAVRTEWTIGVETEVSRRWMETGRHPYRPIAKKNDASLRRLVSTSRSIPTKPGLTFAPRK